MIEHVANQQSRLSGFAKLRDLPRIFEDAHLPLNWKLSSHDGMMFAVWGLHPVNITFEGGKKVGHYEGIDMMHQGLTLLLHIYNQINEHILFADDHED